MALCSHANSSTYLLPVTISAINLYHFLPARCYASAGLCDSDVSVCPSGRHTPVLCLAEQKQDREMYTI